MPTHQRRLQSNPSREEVEYAYRLILGREPENEKVVDAHLRFSTVADLREALIRSDEFASKYRTMSPEVQNHPNLNRARRCVVFIHLQKTGGTSLRRLVGSSFPRERHCPILEDKLHVLTLAELGNYDFFAGHYDISCLRYIPRDNVEAFSIFREPRARLISLYRFLRSHPAGDEFAKDQLIPLAHALTAEEFFERQELRQFCAINNHYLAAFGRSFAWFDQNRNSLSKKSLSTILMDAKLQIRALAGLGITEQFQSSADLICKSLGVTPTESTEALHVTDNFHVSDNRFQRVDPVPITRRLTEGMSDLVEYDSLLYEFALTEFKRRLTLSSTEGKADTPHRTASANV